MGSASGLLRCLLTAEHRTDQSTIQQQAAVGERERERSKETLGNNGTAKETTETLTPHQIPNSAERDQQKHSLLSV